MISSDVQLTAVANSTSGDVVVEVEPSDRYVSLDGASLCVAPYRHVFHAPAKGRWLGLPLLTAFTLEFATVHSECGETAVGDGDGDEAVYVDAAQKRPRSDDACCSDVKVSLCKWDNMHTYMKELAEGTLWIKGREAECLAAGRALVAVADNWRRDGKADSLSQLPIEEVLRSHVPQLLSLTQRDVMLHAVMRHEGPIPFERPLVILHADVTTASTESAEAAATQEKKKKKKGGVTCDATSCPRLLFVDKPYGMPVHPSGKYRKNSVTMLLEDVFGGCDAQRYEMIVEDSSSGAPYRATVRHKQRGFVLVAFAWRVPAATVNAFREFLEQRTSPLKVFVVHRLDVVTTGVLMFALDPISARRTTGLLAEKSNAANALSCVTDLPSMISWEVVLQGAQKRYVARVLGDFHGIFRHADVKRLAASIVDPSAATSDDTHDWALISRPIFCESFFNSFYACPTDDDLPEALQLVQSAQSRFQHVQRNGGGMRLLEELKNDVGASDDHVARSKTTSAVEAKRAAMRRCAANSRPIERPTGEDGGRFSQIRSAVSAFRCLATIGGEGCVTESIVECIPITGRTHQLRVHLAFLGYPISNDLKYVNTSHAAPFLPGDLQPGAKISICNSASERIFLHALSYQLQFPVTQASGDVDGTQSVQVKTELPEWCLTN